MENNTMSSTLKLEDIEALFKNKESFTDQEKIISAIYNQILAPSLVGVDYEDIKELIKSGDTYKVIFSNLDGLLEYQKDIESAEGIIVIVTFGKNGTLDQLENGICKKYFPNKKVISIAQISEDVPESNPKIDLLLVYKKRWKLCQKYLLPQFIATLQLF